MRRIPLAVPATVIAAALLVALTLYAPRLAEAG